MKQKCNKNQNQFIQNVKLNEFKNNKIIASFAYTFHQLKLQILLIMLILN